MTYVRIIGHVENATHGAILLRAGRDDKLWIPRWACKNGDLVEKDDAEIQVSEKWLLAKGADGWVA
jgi:hypothetical protein